MDVITYPWLGWNNSMLVKGAPVLNSVYENDSASVDYMEPYFLIQK